MKMKQLLVPCGVCFSLMLLCLPASAQAPDILWEHGNGGNGDDRARDVIETPDGGFLTVGYGNSTDGDMEDQHGLDDWLAVKADAEGNPEWSKVYGGSDYDYCYAACNAFGGGYMLAGNTRSTDGDVTFNHGLTDAWLIKTDTLGNIQWQKTYGGSSYDGILDILPTTDGKYLLVCWANSSDGDVSGHHGALYSDYWLVKIDTAGAILWQHCYGSNAMDGPFSALETKNGDFVVAGYTEGFDGDVTAYHGGVTDFWVIRMDSAGNLLWEKCLGGSGEDDGYAITEGPGQGFLVAGATDSDDDMVTGFHGWEDVWVVALDSLGSLLWERTYGGTGAEEAHSVCRFDQNTFFFSGVCWGVDGDVEATYGNTDGWVVALDSTGAILWSQNYGGSDDDFLYKIRKTASGDLVMAGYSASTDFDVTPSWPGINFWTVYLDVCALPYYPDNDGDGFGNPLLDTLSCGMPPGYADNHLDCDDTDPDINPLAADICNGIDDNCNGAIDEDAPFVAWFADADADSFGNPLADSLACAQPSGFVPDSTDCDDTNAAIYPGAPETLNGLDDNCNGIIDEGLALADISAPAISLYPNPCSGLLYCNYAGTPIDMVLRNVFGQSLWMQTGVTGPLQIDISGLAAGVYILQCSSSGGMLYATSIIKEN